LEVLEDLLLDYDGTLLLVSHDRAFLNNLVTSTLILSGDGEVKEYVGGYDDWQKQIEPATASKTSKSAVINTADSKKPEKRKLSYNDKRELEELPKRIEILEREQHQLTVQMEAPAFYQQEGEKITQAVNRLEEIQKELSQAYQRWGELDS
jgi:ATP-binding cassette subfamily F protein uup